MVSSPINAPEFVHLLAPHHEIAHTLIPKKQLAHIEHCIRSCCGQRGGKEKDMEEQGAHHIFGNARKRAHIEQQQQSWRTLPPWHKGSRRKTKEGRREILPHGTLLSRRQTEKGTGIGESGRGRERIHKKANNTIPASTQLKIDTPSPALVGGRTSRTTSPRNPL